MGATPIQRLFTPGTGAIPPALTGREPEQAVLSACLADLIGGSSPPHDVVLVGPRGNGKTVLLNWFKRACRNRRAPVDVVLLTPRDIPSQEDLIDALSPRAGVSKLLPRKVGVAAMGSAEWPAPGRGPRNLSRVLAARCRKRPLVVLLDEAHTLDVDVGGTLLNASQRIRDEAPFLLVFAGTPGLPAHFNAMNASFWGRLGDGLLGIGRLSADAAAEALAKPLATQGVDADADALAAAVEHSQRYPYFVQLWGHALWRQHLTAGVARLTAEHAAAARGEVSVRAAEYYQTRYRELEAEGLLAAAVAIAPAFQGGADAEATDRGVDLALAESGAEDARARLTLREGLNRLGYIWCPPGQLPPITWRTGIPSLTTYVVDQAGAREK